MKREEFAAFVQTTIEEVTRLAEEKSGHQLQRKYAFRWLGGSQPITAENIVQYVVDRVFVDEEHIYPCVDVGVGDVLEDGLFRWGGLKAAPRCGSADRSLTQQGKQEIDHGDGSP